jgi:regulator of protease activity HflC (stomatin/prohibitin superfamily)
MNSNSSSIVRFLIGFLVLIVLLGAVFGCFQVVQPGHAGVFVRLGQVRPIVVAEGVHMKIPFIDTIEQLDIRQSTENAQASAASKDLQTVTTDITVIYSLVGSYAPKIFQRIGPRDAFAHVVITPALQECLKSVTAKYTAEQLVTQRSAVKADVERQVNEFIKKSLLVRELDGCVMIDNIAITEFRFSREFDRAIEEKVRAEQEALKAEREKQKIVTQAEAAKEQSRLQSEAKAIAINSESIARAEAIKRESEALKANPELIQLRLVERWDGKLPQFQTNAGGVTPIIDLNHLMTPAAPAK